MEPTDEEDRKNEARRLLCNYWKRHPVILYCMDQEIDIAENDVKPLCK